ELSAARRRAEEALAQERWLAGIGQTTLSLEHEINNPLPALLATAELASLTPDLSASLREDLALIATSARRIASVTRELSVLKNPATVEYVNGTRMLNVGTLDGATRQSA